VHKGQSTDPDGSTNLLPSEALVLLAHFAGPSGSGKSTLFKLVLAPCRPGV